MVDILRQCHSLEYGGHFNGQRTTTKVLQSGFYWPSLFKDTHLEFRLVCENGVQIDDTFLNEQILALSHAKSSPWFADIGNYLADIIYGMNPYSFD